MSSYDTATTSGDQRPRARALLIGVAVGDALGWPQEQNNNIVGGRRAQTFTPTSTFRDWERYGGTQFAKYHDPVAAGEYSDDTQLTLCVARACSHGEEWWQWLTSVELPSWLSYQRGGGGAILSAARSWLNGVPPWSAQAKPAVARRYFGAGSNGAAMRIAAHVLVTAGRRDDLDLARRVLLDAIATHGHERALVGAIAQAQLLRASLRHTGTLAYGELLEAVADSDVWTRVDPEVDLPEEWVRSYVTFSGRSPRESWRRAVVEFQDLCVIARGHLARGALANDDAALEAFGCFDRRRNGSGVVSAVAATYISARSAPAPMTGLLRSAFLQSADTDTLAAMTTSALAGVHGSSWMNGLATSVQDADYIASLADQTTERPAATFVQNASLFDWEASRPAVKAADARRFRDSLAHAQRGDELRFLDGRTCQVVETMELSTAGRAEARRWRLLTTDGQSLFIDHVAKGPARSKALEAENLSGSLEGASPNRASVMSVALPVANLAASATFYRNVLGVSVRGTGRGYVELADWLRLESTHDVALEPGAVIQLLVADVRAVHERLGLPGSAVNPLELRDPDGRRLIIRDAST